MFALHFYARLIYFVALLDLIENLEHSRSLFRVVIKVKSFEYNSNFMFVLAPFTFSRCG